MQISVEAISGVCFGVEFFLGDNLMPEDQFAMSLDLFIIRFIVVVPK